MCAFGRQTAAYLRVGVAGCSRCFRDAAPAPGLFAMSALGEICDVQTAF